MLWCWPGGARAANQADGQRSARPGTGYGQPAQAAGGRARPLAVMA